MNRIMTLSAVVLCVLVFLRPAPVCAGPLEGPMGAMDGFVGVWEISAEWASGQPLWARTHYEPVLAGKFLASTTLVIEPNGTLYERYSGVIAHDSARGVFPAHTFSFMGTHSVADLVPDGPGAFTIEWSNEGGQVRERLELRDADTMQWTVWLRESDAAEWEVQLDGQWRRLEKPGRAEAPWLPLTDAVRPLAPMLGSWEVHTAWPDGKPMWSLMKTESAPSGAYLRYTTITRDGEAQPYERYRGFLIREPGTENFREIVFTNRGDVQDRPATMTTGETPVFESTIPAGVLGAFEVHKRCTFTSETAFDWLVRGRDPKSEGWQTLGEGVWRRVSPGRAQWSAPIEHDRFVGFGGDVRSFALDATIDAPVEMVYWAWSTSDGWEAVYADGNPTVHGDIALAIGGRYEWLFNGVVGSNGCQVLSYVPNKMLSFSWNAPPTHSTRPFRTWVVVDFEAAGEESTRLRLTHLGFGEGPEWDKSMDYFQRAWGFAINRVKTQLEAMPRPAPADDGTE